MYGIKPKLFQCFQAALHEKNSYCSHYGDFSSCFFQPGRRDQKCQMPKFPKTKTNLPKWQDQSDQFSFNFDTPQCFLRQLEFHKKSSFSILKKLFRPKRSSLSFWRCEFFQNNIFQFTEVLFSVRRGEGEKGKMFSKAK